MEKFSEKYGKKFEKTYILDANIILDDVEHLYTLSENGKNLIVINDVVLDEIDSKKSGLNSFLAYQAREFARFCEKAELVEMGPINSTARRNILKNGDIELHLVILNHYESDSKIIDPKIINDRKIIECASKIKDYYDNVTLLSNDINFRTRSNLEGLMCYAFKSSNKSIKELQFFKTINLEYDISLPTDIEKIKFLCPDLEYSVTGFEFVNTTSGKITYGYRDGTVVLQLDEEALKKQNAVPINLKQKILSHLMLSSANDVVVVEGSAGCGKNIIATSAACALKDMKNSPYEKIVYIRKTVTSTDNKQEELGFLPGSLEDKLSVYMKPMFNTIEKLIKRKYKEFKPKTKEEMDEKVKEFIQDYNIQFEYEGFLRGATIDNAIVILDEHQNDSASSTKLIMTRMGENCKVFVLGCTNQIDNIYLNKNNNALTFLLNECNKQNPFSVNMVGLELTDTVRSKIAKYADSW
jgi:PhoH-like ATPase